MTITLTTQEKNKLRAVFQYCDSYSLRTYRIYLSYPRIIVQNDGTTSRTSLDGGNDPHAKMRACAEWARWYMQRKYARLKRTDKPPEPIIG